MVGYVGVSFGLGMLPLSGFLPVTLRDGWIVGAYALTWLLASFNLINFSPYLMGATAEHERNHAFAIQMALFPVAGFAGNLIGGLLPAGFAALAGVGLDSALPYRNALLVAAAINLLAFVATWFTVDITVKTFYHLDSLFRCFCFKYSVTKFFQHSPCYFPHNLFVLNN